MTHGYELHTIQHVLPAMLSYMYCIVVIFLKRKILPKLVTRVLHFVDFLYQDSEGRCIYYVIINTQNRKNNICGLMMEAAGETSIVITLAKNIIQWNLSIVDTLGTVLISEVSSSVS